MIFQAFRTLYPSSGSYSAKVQNGFIAKYSSLRVPCAPVRSSFSSALDDVRRFRALGYVSTVRMVSFNQSTTI